MVATSEALALPATPNLLSVYPAEPREEPPAAASEPPLCPVPLPSAGPSLVAAALPCADARAPPEFACCAPPDARLLYVFEAPALLTDLLPGFAPPPPTTTAPPLALAPPTFVAPPVALAPVRPAEPPVAHAPPLLEAPPVPWEPLVPVKLPLPCNVVTLEASRLSDNAPFAAVTLPSLAKLLLAEVVNRSYEDMLEPLTVRLSDFDELFVFTTTITTSEAPV